MKKNLVNYHTQGIFFEETLRKRHGSKNHLIVHEDKILDTIARLKKIKSKMMAMIELKNQSIQRVKSENLKLRTINKELTGTLSYKKKAIFILKSYI